MGKFLDRTASLWKNPEESYKAKGNGKSRKEFFNELCGAVNGEHQLDLLKSRVLKEYNDNPEIASQLQEYFDKIASKWDKIKTMEINNLNTLVASILTDDFDVGSEDLTLGVDPYKLLSVEKVSFAFMLEKFSILGDIACLDSKGNGSLYMVNCVEKETDIFIYKNQESRKELVESGLKSSFVEPTLDLLTVLESDGKLQPNSVFVGRPFFRKNGEKVVVNLEENRWSCNIVDTLSVGTKKILECRNLEDNLETVVYCIA